MEKDRVVAFSDGVIAVIITIMVLDLKAPHATDLSALKQTIPVFLSYVLSFVYVAIYWSNHHHFFHLVHRVNGGVLWANLHLLFWLSLVPFTTSWMGENFTAAVPTAVYGVSLLMAALGWYVMQTVIVRTQGRDFASGERSRRRPQGQDFAAALHRRHPVGVLPRADRRRHLCAGRPNVAGARQAHRANAAAALIAPRWA